MTIHGPFLSSVDQGYVWLYMLFLTTERQMFFNPYHFAGEDQSGGRGIWR